jgi:hypothetical protein
MPGQNARRTGRLRPDKTWAWSSVAAQTATAEVCRPAHGLSGAVMDLLLVAAEVQMSLRPEIPPEVCRGIPAGKVATT